MIDRRVFAEQFAMLEDRFNREFSKDSKAMYYEVLSDELSTEEFQVAVRDIFRSATYFPKPDDFVEAVQGDEQQKALEDWEKVEDVFLNLASPDDLSPEGRRTVKLMGGWRQIGKASDSDWPHVRKEFLRLYGDAVRMEDDDHDKLPPEDSRAEELLEEVTGAVSIEGETR